MPRELILSFDLGTTRLKVAAFDLCGDCIGRVSRRNQDHYDGEYQFQSARAWWIDAIAATRELLQVHGIGAHEVVGCSLSGRAGAAVFTDADGAVIADPWSDNRHRNELKSILKGPVPNYAAALLAKWLWLQTHQPDAAAKVRHVLYAKDFLLFQLTGEAVTDPSSGPDGDWDATLLATLGIEPELLPRPRLPWTIAGGLTPGAANDLGLREGTPVAVGAHDGICANTGTGAINDGQFAMTLGTHGVVRTVSSTWPEGSLRFYGYPIDKHVIGANALWAGFCLDWFVDTFTQATEADRQETFASLDASASLITKGQHGVCFLPYPGGQISPLRRPTATATFHGLKRTTGTAEMYRAVLEGASFAIADGLEQLTHWCGAPQSIGVTGSGVRSQVWMQMLADITGQALHVTDDASEGRGAAIFCATALGYYPELLDATAAMVKVSQTFVPDETNPYGRVRERWRALGFALRDFETHAEDGPRT